MAKTARTIRTACELPDGALIVIAELADWLRIPVKTIYNGGQGTNTLPCVFLDSENKRHRRWRVGAVRAWLSQHESTTAPAMTAPAAPGVVVPIQRKRKAAPEGITPEGVAWFQERLAHYQARQRQS